MEILGKNGQQYYFISESRGRIGDMLSPLSSFFVSLSYLIHKCVLLHCIYLFSLYCMVWFYWVGISVTLCILVASDWCISKPHSLFLVSVYQKCCWHCQCKKLFPQQCAMVQYKSVTVLSVRRHPAFRNFNSCLCRCC